MRIAYCLFFIYALIGLFLYDDYGCGPDEGMERQTSLVNLKYAVRKLNLPIGEKNRSWLEYLPELKEYRDRYYGTALHLPLVLVECLSHFELESWQFYGMRHFYTFLNYFIGLIFFYNLLTVRFGSRKYGLAGVMIMILTPRFFAESFYNNKDVLFTAWYVICAFCMDRWLRSPGTGQSVMLAFALALTCNTRFNGIIFLPAFIILFGIKSFREKRIIFYEVRFLLLTLILAGFFFYLITPNFWENPMQTLVETLQFNMRHPNHGSDGNLFNGVLVDAARTWQFIPVWILLTVPSVYIILSFGGTLWFLGAAGRSCLERNWKRICLTDLLMAGTGFAAVIFIIMTHVTIYNGWRHCYFAFPCIVYFAVFFIQKVCDSGKKALKTTVLAFLCGAFLYNGFWIVKYHPYEYVYFTPWAKNHSNAFSGDYWGISTRALFEYITENDPERMLKINHVHTPAGSINRGLLPEEESKYLELTYEVLDDVDYYLVCRDDIPSVDVDLPRGFKKVFHINVDGDEIAAVFQKTN